MDIEIVKDLLPEEQFKHIQEIVFNQNFYWFFNEGVVSANDGHYQFTHGLYETVGHKGILTSEYFDIFNPVFDKLDAFYLLSAKINCNPRTDKVIEHGLHEDFDTKNKYKSAIFYLNTNNGYTKFKTGRKVISEENKLVIFDGGLFHTGATNTCDKLRRVCLNIVYVPKE